MIVTLLLICTLQVNPPYETNPVKIVVNATIKVYQKIFSPLQGDVCNFSPSCSNFARQSFDRHGILWGSMMTADRLMRCQPGAIDHLNVYYHGIKDHKLYDPVQQNYIFYRMKLHDRDDCLVEEE